MTVKLFWTKPYRTICEANVVSADGADIVLDPAGARRRGQHPSEGAEDRDHARSQERLIPCATVRQSHDAG